MKNIIKLCTGLSVLGLTACCSTNECAEPVREVVVQEEVVMMHPEAAVHPEHHKKHHKKHHHAAHKAAPDCEHPAHKAAPSKNKAVDDMQNKMQHGSAPAEAPAQGATESK